MYLSLDKRARAVQTCRISASFNDAPLTELFSVSAVQVKLYLEYISGLYSPQDVLCIQLLIPNKFSNVLRFFIWLISWKLVWYHDVNELSGGKLKEWKTVKSKRRQEEATKYHLLLLQVFCLANNRMSMALLWGGGREGYKEIQEHSKNWNYSLNMQSGSLFESVAEFVSFMAPSLTFLIFFILKIGEKLSKLTSLEWF